MANRHLLTNVFNEIDRSDEAGFAWNQKRDLIAHTGVVLLLDKNPVYTFDFGGNLTYCSGLGSTMLGSKQSSQTSSAAMLSPVKSGVAINRFQRSESSVKGKLASFPINTKKQKGLVKQLVEKLLNIDMGPYELLKNNCRDFVEAANGLITKFYDTHQIYFGREITENDNNMNQTEFRSGMTEVKNVDGRKVITAAVGGAAVLGGILYVGSKILGSGSNQNRDERHNYY